jgi:DNA-directed RNA polymerase subunit F
VLNHSLNELYITITSAEAFLRKKKVKGDLRQMARNNILLLKKIGILDITTYKKGRSQAYVHKQLKDMLMRP